MPKTSTAPYTCYIFKVYPAAKIRCLIFAPQYALNYKFANALSVMQFQKYQKRGYDVQFELMHSASDRKLWKDRGHSSIEANASKGRKMCCPGLAYFQNWSENYWEGGLLFIRFKTTTNGILRFELRAFAYLARLWETGGVFTDYTTLLRRELQPEDRGLDLGPRFSTIKSRSMRGIQGWYPTPAEKELEAQRKLEEAVSKKKRNGPRSHLSGPWANLDTSYDRKYLSVDGALPDSAEKNTGFPASKDETCHGSIIMRFAPKDPVLRCILEKYDANLGDLCDRQCLSARARACRDKDALAQRTSDAHQNSSAMRREGGANGRSLLSGMSNMEALSHGHFKSSLVDWGTCDASHQEKTDDNPNPATLPFMWLGSDAQTGRWRGLGASGPLVGAAVSNMFLRRWPEVLRPLGTTVDVENSSRKEAVCSDIIRDQWKHCTPFRKSKGSETMGYSKGARSLLFPSFIHRSENPPYGDEEPSKKTPLESQQDEEAATMRCAPSVFIAGAMKCASTYLFNVLASHPQVRVAVGCYCSVFSLRSKERIFLCGKLRRYSVPLKVLVSKKLELTLSKTTVGSPSNLGAQR